MLRFLVIMLLASCAPSALAQTPAPLAGPGTSEAPATQATPAGDEAVVQTVTGCVSREEAGDVFTLADIRSGAFQLTGVDLRKYVGQRVEAKGTTRRLRIVGGLWPTPNIAAQSGAIDPLQTTIAAMPGSGTRGTEPGTAAPPPAAELRVERIRTVKGRCP